MNKNIAAALVIAAGLVAAAFVHSGRYFATRLDQHRVVIVDRWTGETKIVESDEAWLEGR